jgi:hypothetical protein
MRLIFTITYELDIEEDNLFGDTPTQYLKSSMEEDPALLLDNAVIESYRLKKVLSDEDLEEENEDDEEDTDD